MTYAKQITGLLVCALPGSSIIWLSACTSIDHTASCNHFLAMAASASAAQDYARAQAALSEAGREAELSDEPSQKHRVLREQASTFLSQDKPAEAELTARQLIKIYDGTSEKNMSRSSRTELVEERSRARLILSDALLAQKRPDDAVSVLEAARKELAKEFGGPALWATVDDHYLAALRASGKAANIPGISAEADILSTSEAGGLIEQALRLQASGRYQEALVLLKQARQAAVRSGVEETYVRATFQLACTNYLLNHATEGEKLAQEAVEKARSAHDVKPSIKASALAMLALTSTDPHIVAEALKAASSISPGGAIPTLCSVATVHDHRPFSARARECDLIWSLAQKASALDRLQSIMLRFSIFSERKDERIHAVSWLVEQAKSPLLQPSEQMLCYEFAARLCIMDNRPAEVKKYILEALQLREKVKESDVPDIPIAAFRLAEDYNMIGRSQEAIAAGQRALPLLSAQPRLSACLMLMIARSYRTEHQDQKALEYYDKALVLYRHENLPELQAILAERAQFVAQSNH